VVTDRQTDRQTYAGDSIIPRESFRGDNYYLGGSKPGASTGLMSAMYGDLGMSSRLQSRGPIIHNFLRFS